MSSLLRGRERWALLAILLLALLLRLRTVGFGLPALYDPDELMFEMGAVRMLRGATLNPGWFGHPATTTMYVLAIVNAGVFGVGYVLGLFASPRQFAEIIYTDPSWVILPGRIAMVLFALGTIWLVWWLARRFFGPWAGLVAAALLAVDPVHVTWSQIIRSDMMACFFLLLCLRACCGIVERGLWRDYLLASLWLGLAIATKWPFVLAGLAIVGSTTQAARAGVMSPRRAIQRAVVSVVVALVVLVVASPFLVIEWSTVARNLSGEQQVHHLGATGGGWFDNFRWYLSGPLLTGFGAIGLILVALGAARLSRIPMAVAILVPVTIGFLILLCSQRLVWERWALPLIPMGAILAGGGLATIVTVVRRWRFAPVGLGLVFVAAIAAPLATLSADDRMRSNDTRSLASAWARANIPHGSTLLVEHFAWDLVYQPWRFLFPVGDAGCVDVAMLLDGKTSYASIDRARGERSNVDYGTVAASQRASCRADFAILTQYDRYRMERSRFPREYVAYRDLITQGRIVATFAPSPGRIGGPLVRIVRFR